MTREELLALLKADEDDFNFDKQEHHIKADEALLEYINDPEITEAFNSVEKWYS